MFFQLSLQIKQTVNQKTPMFCILRMRKINLGSWPTSQGWSRIQVKSCLPLLSTFVTSVPTVLAKKGARKTQGQGGEDRALEIKLSQPLLSYTHSLAMPKFFQSKGLIESSLPVQPPPLPHIKVSRMLKRRGQRPKQQGWVIPGEN